MNMDYYIIYGMSRIASIIAQNILYGKTMLIIWFVEETDKQVLVNLVTDWVVQIKIWLNELNS